jgi:hypothetical protein
LRAQIRKVLILNKSGNFPAGTAMLPEGIVLFPAGNPTLPSGNHL